MVYTIPMEPCLAVKLKDALTPATTWMSLEDMTLRQDEPVTKGQMPWDLT